MKPIEGRKRVIIESLQPQIECGRYPAKSILGDEITVSAALFGDGHDHVTGRVFFRYKSDRGWRCTPLTRLDNDIFTASFTAARLGLHSFYVEGWIDHFGTWCADLKKRLAALPNPGDAQAPVQSQNIPLALRTGAEILEEVLPRAKGADAKLIEQIALSLRWLADQDSSHYEYPLYDDFIGIVAQYPDPDLVTRSGDLDIWVDRERARYSTWYELFPRSASSQPGQHGTLDDVRGLLPEIAAMGFDVLYMPPIHPIGMAYRKGPNNSVTAVEGDLGSPWAIGSPEGGHKAIHPQLGTFDDFKALVAAATERNIDIALDIAFQCSPDHPWVIQHPTWFRWRPDGTIQYAENPPKKYQDIYPLNFESPDWRGLWEELRSVFEFWIDLGVSVFRVDNPHTKALPFWEWCIAELRSKHPQVIFLAEAFTRPHVMYSLAKAGYTQSYTYFTWRNSKPELEEYFNEITKPPVSDFFHPNLWPNTPDILHEALQLGGRPAHMQRLVLAATLGANYGIYGPPYELAECTPVRHGSEEYLDSEKYQIRQRDLSSPGSLRPFITRINQIRRENRALQSNRSLRFHLVDNPSLICYSKRSGSNIILTTVNLDPHNEQAGWIDLDLKELGIPHTNEFQVEDLLTNETYTWRGRSNFIALRPDVRPAHIFLVTP